MARPVGSTNKPKQALIALLKAKYPEYHPVMELAAVANNDVKCDACDGKGYTFGRDKDFKELELREACDICLGTGKAIITMDMKFNANKEVAQYVTPKLKAVEMNVSGGLSIYKPVIKRFDGSMDESEEDEPVE